ncbi:MAG: DUF1801 domain-containing protein [Anaerolineales bacterium]|nr:DUF1801 domain-containing protein [Anaerolineales bacterium]
MPYASVDAYLADKVSPDLRPVVDRLFALMAELAPQATLGLYYGAPMWKGAGYLAWISAAKAHISLGFTHGRAFEDKYGLLRGSGKHAMNLQFQAVDEIKPGQVRYYVKQALKHDQRRPPGR